MTAAKNRKVGAAIALTGAMVAAVGAFVGLATSVVVGIAVVCILIGTGISQGNFSSTNSKEMR